MPSQIHQQEFRPFYSSELLETSESDYDHNLIEESRTELPDWVKKLSIAAVVDLTPARSGALSS